MRLCPLRQMVDHLLFDIDGINDPGRQMPGKTHRQVAGTGADIGNTVSRLQR